MQVISFNASKSRRMNTLSLNIITQHTWAGALEHLRSSSKQGKQKQRQTRQCCKSDQCRDNHNSSNFTIRQVIITCVFRLEGVGKEGPGKEGEGKEGPGKEGEGKEGEGKEGPGKEGEGIEGEGIEGEGIDGEGIEGEGTEGVGNLEGDGKNGDGTKGVGEGDGAGGQ